MKRLLIAALVLNATAVLAQSAPKAPDPKTPDVKTTVTNSATLRDGRLIPPEPPKLDAKLMDELQRKSPNKDERKALVAKQESIEGQLTPLTPEQILRIQQRAQEDEYLTNSAVSKPRSSINRDISLSIGSDIPEVHMSIGYATTILFFDSTGKPIPVSKAGAIPGDGNAIDANSTGNAVVLYVKKPWRSTNLTVFLEGQPVPTIFSLTSDRNGDKPIDAQVRARIFDASQAASLDRQDMQNVNALMQLTNGAPGAANSMSVISVRSVEKSNPGNMSWSPVPNGVAQFRAGPEGLIYILLRPGMKLLYPSVPAVLSSLTGADGTQGYIVAGGNTRVYTVQDTYGSLYRITIQK